MSDNVIFNDRTENTYGFYKDLRENIIKQLEEFTEQQDWEYVKEMADLLIDMNATWENNENMLVLSQNNGMGYTIKEYEKGD